MPAPMDRAKLDGQRGQDLMYMGKCVSDTSTCLSQMLREFKALLVESFHPQMSLKRCLR